MPLNLNSRSTIERVRIAASRFSAEYPLAGATSVYAIDGHSLINADTLGLQAAITTGKSFGRATDVSLPVSAETIHISERGMRLIRLSEAPHLTAKVNFIGGPPPVSLRTDSRSFRREIRMWREAKRVESPLIVSDILDFSIEGEWFVEALIKGRAMLDGERRHFLLNVMVPFYRASVKHRPLRRLRNAPKLVADLREMGSGLLEPTLNDRLPFVLAHGDLYRDNVMRSKAGYHLIDWEYGGVHPAAFDLARLYQQDSSMREQIVDAIALLDPAGDCMPPETQLALGVLAATEKLRAPTREWQEYAAYKSAVSLQEAERRKSLGQQEVRKFIHALRTS